MRHGALFHQDRCVVPHVMRTSNAWERMRGLLGRPVLQSGQALLIDPCPSVHTFGMGYPIDLLFLDAQYRVLKQVDALAPRRLSACKNARATLELPPGSTVQLALQAGDQLEWRPH